MWRLEQRLSRKIAFHEHNNYDIVHCHANYIPPHWVEWVWFKGCIKKLSLCAWMIFKRCLKTKEFLLNRNVGSIWFTGMVLGRSRMESGMSLE